MDRLSELEERVGYLESSRTSNIDISDVHNKSTIVFNATSYYVDVAIDVSAPSLCRITVTFNGTKNIYETNMLTLRLDTKKTNLLRVEIDGGTVLSKRIRIEGVGVKLLNQ